MNKLLGLSSRVCLMVSLLVTYAAAQDPPRVLTLNSAIERELAAGQTNSYTLNLDADQIANVIVEQRGIDIVVRVIAPDGKTLFEVDSPNGAQGQETATVYAAGRGAYRIEIRSLSGQSPAGKYQIRLDQFLTESDYQTERLAALGRLWGAIKFFHPGPAYTDIDLDGALVKVIPQVKAAHTPDQYRRAIGDLLQVLNDPETRVVESPSGEKSPPFSSSSGRKEPVYFRVVDGFVIVVAAEWTRALASGDNAALARQPEMMTEIGKAKGIIVDCRIDGESTSELIPLYLEYYLQGVVPSLVQGPVTLGTARYRRHDGYPSQQGISTDFYISSLMTDNPGAILGSAQSRKPLAVVIDETTPNLIPLLSGLQAYGARIVRVGQGNNTTAASVRQILLPDGVRVRLRTADFVHPDGSASFQADVQAAGGKADNEAGISAAIAALNESTDKKRAPVTNAPAVTVLRSLKDEPYPEMRFPGEEYRLLALFRFWNVMHYFYPYKHLLDRPWSTVLTDFIPRFLANNSAVEYEITVAEMVARIQDTHGRVEFRALNEYLGMFAPPLILQSVSGKLAIAGLPDASWAQSAGLNVGDIILTINGEPAEQRVTFLSKFKALSTPQAADRFIVPTVLRGAKDSKVLLRVEGVTGQIREIELTRTVALGSVAVPVGRKTPIYQTLPNGYGYIDLARLPLADAHQALDAVMNTPAIIFDMRGYPNGTAWPIAPRLTEKKNFTIALFRRPIQSAREFSYEPSETAPDHAFEQKLPPASRPIYKGKVVMLINQDAISQAEHTALAFEAATDTTFVGSPTNGANGDVTNLVLPGGISVNFSGHDVRHADGRQLQRLGIQPHIKVEPTITGTREGRDEVLEAAIKFLDSTVKR